MLISHHKLMGENALTKTITSWQTAVPFLADLFMLILALIFVIPIAQKFGTPSGLNTLLVGLGYILFCIGVFRLRKLENDPTKLEQPSRLLQFLMERRTRMVLGVLFGIGMMLFISQQLGYLELLFTDPYSLGEGQAAAFFVFAPSAWLGVSLFYIPVLAFTVTPTIAAHTSQYMGQSLFALLATNGLLLLGTAQLRAVSSGGFGWFVLALILLLIWFAPPRLVYVEKQASALPLLTFLPLLLTCAWLIAF
jgi:hypothetical protein